MHYGNFSRYRLSIIHSILKAIYSNCRCRTTFGLQKKDALPSLCALNDTKDHIQWKTAFNFKTGTTEQKTHLFIFNVYLIYLLFCKTDQITSDRLLYVLPEKN